MSDSRDSSPLSPDPSLPGFRSAPGFLPGLLLLTLTALATILMVAYLAASALSDARRAHLLQTLPEIVARERATLEHLVLGMRTALPQPGSLPAERLVETLSPLLDSYPLSVVVMNEAHDIVSARLNVNKATDVMLEPLRFDLRPLSREAGQRVDSAGAISGLLLLDNQLTIAAITGIPGTPLFLVLLRQLSPDFWESASDQHHLAGITFVPASAGDLYPTEGAIPLYDDYGDKLGWLLWTPEKISPLIRDLILLSALAAVLLAGLTWRMARRHAENFVPITAVARLNDRYLKRITAAREALQHVPGPDTHQQTLGRILSVLDQSLDQDVITFFIEYDSHASTGITIAQTHVVHPEHQMLAQAFTESHPVLDEIHSALRQGTACHVSPDVNSAWRTFLKTLRTKINESTPYRQLIAQPVLADRQARGALFILNRDESLFTDTEISHIETIADILGLSLAWQGHSAPNVHLLYQDPVSGLANRFHLHLFLDALHRLSVRTPAQCALVSIRIINFDTVVQRYGPSAGDTLIRETANRLKESNSDNHLLARTERQTFAVAIPGAQEIEDLVFRVRQLTSHLSGPQFVDGIAVYPEFAFGIWMDRPGAHSPEEMTRLAEHTCLLASSDSKDPFLFHSPELQARAHAVHEAYTQLLLASGREQIDCRFLPLIDLKNQCITGVEALIQVSNARLSDISTESLLKCVDALQQGPWLDATILKKACLTLRHLEQSGHHALNLSVNITGSALATPEFLATLREILADTGVSPQRLIIGVAEQWLATHSEPLGEAAKKLASDGIRLAIDQIRLEKTTLGTLTGLPVHQFKLANDVLPRVAENASLQRQLTALIASAGLQGAEVVAVGLETQKQLDTLKALGITAAQGFLFGPALDREHLVSGLDHTGLRIRQDF